MIFNILKSHYLKILYNYFFLLIETLGVEVIVVQQPVTVTKNNEENINYISLDKLKEACEVAENLDETVFLYEVCALLFLIYFL